MSAEKRLKELGIDLGTVSAPVANYVNAVRTGNLLFLAGKGPRAGKDGKRPPRLLELPTSTASPGAPRIWAYGRRVRIPVHTMFQSDKVRESNVSGPKGGVVIIRNAVKRVWARFSFSWCDSCAAATCRTSP